MRQKLIDLINNWYVIIYHACKRPLKLKISEYKCLKRPIYSLRREGAKNQTIYKQITRTFL